MRRLICSCVVAAIMGCGSPVVVSSSSSSSAEGGGGTGGVTISTVSTSSSTTSSTGTGGTACTVAGAAPCGVPGADADIYPDPLASYNVALPFVSYINPIPGTDEVGNGAGVVVLGPWETDRDFAGFEVVLASSLPDPLRFAAWSEPQCGLPVDPPGDHASDVALADLPQVDIDGAVRVTITAAVHVPAGAGLYLSIITSKFSTALRTVQTTGPLAPRAAWYGLVDNDCDGVADLALGYAWLDDPTAPNVSEFHYDLAFDAIEAPAP